MNGRRLLLVTAIAAVLVALGVFAGSRLGTPDPATTNAAVSTATATATISSPILSLCGSNTIGSQLGPDLIRGFLQAQGATAIGVNSSGPDEKTVGATISGQQQSVRVAAHGSATAFIGLANGSCDVGMASRRIKPAEIVALRAFGNMVSPAAEHVIGLDGIAVIVNAANPLRELTVAQLKMIFSSATTSWTSVGATSFTTVAGRDNSTIRVYARDTKSGTFDTFAALVLEGTPLASSARRFENSTALSNAVAVDPRAIGFIGLPYIGQAKALKIAAGAGSLAPTILTVGRESYPLTRRLFLYTPVTPLNPLVRKFVSYVQSDAGQSLVNQDGFVGTVTGISTSRGSSASLPTSTPERYRKLVDSLNQVGFNFYFNSGSDQLDNKALIDVGRVVGILSTGRNARKQVVLVGFSDSTGDATANLALSERRARVAARELESQGVRVKETTGFGAALPIRDNASDAGREKNRRVEIFITR